MSKLMYNTIMVCCLLLTVLIPIPAEAGHGDWFRQCDRQPITSFWEQQIAGSPVEGRGMVCETPFGLWSTITARGLTPGNAYTVWWVYIDEPGKCAGQPLPSPEVIPFPEPPGYAGQCGLADFFTTDESGEFLNPLAVFGRMDAAIARSHGRTRFAGDFRHFEPRPGSQVWMFIFGHGPADTSDKRQLARQLLTPEDPGTGAPHLGIEGRPFGYPAGVVVIDIPED